VVRVQECVRQLNHVHGTRAQDAQTFAEWGVDFMKLDCCNTSMEMKNVSYPKWAKALNATGRPIVYRCVVRRGEDGHQR
jgi:hypothetical protein